MILNNNLIAENSPNYPKLLESLAKTYAAIENNDQAKKYYLKTIKSLEQIYGSKHKKTALAKKEYKEVYSQLKSVGM